MSLFNKKAKDPVKDPKELAIEAIENYFKIKDLSKKIMDQERITRLIAAFANLMDGKNIIQKNYGHIQAVLSSLNGDRVNLENIQNCYGEIHVLFPNGLVVNKKEM